MLSYHRCGGQVALPLIADSQGFDATNEVSSNCVLG
jgi:hypothetical protein